MNLILPQNILLVDKPSGITSFDCIRILRRKTGIRKMGHAGTLDPMATGLMIIGVEAGTKRLHEFLKLDKTYEAEILLGVQTDTGDVTGKVIRHGAGNMEQAEEFSIINYQFSKNDPISKISKEEIEKVLMGMVGKLELPVPAYSAIKRGGEALYKKARRGEKVDTPIKTMEITSVEFLGLHILPFVKGVPHSNEGRDLKSSALADLPVSSTAWQVGSDTSFCKGGISLPVIKARFDVTSGTYIRSLAEDLGRRLGVPATLAGLRRTRIGEFRVEDAQKIDP
ncbi:MAG: hypothetical protein COV91_03185 [Candidatus Taylorbacteria bacterium CG11_big_fil_rev_8_21_14_0_20_46_11]|uniref:tRNA pseudouridine synthase B n=1 Tax=Candidatus Taylorbacteria bacterium CG11_big_fil_rev_8_21_14_0_20_46_11 TaxID=1975025 RepID=A0A2H0KBH1_9BACT|nr:MAG: hypothetical protein COV91_03185 [Candidatus Taylorbacteria bacterium CG11_big_fil_rev_8_21_14_0_20_46_11]